MANLEDVRVGALVTYKFKPGVGLIVELNRDIAEPRDEARVFWSGIGKLVWFYTSDPHLVVQTDGGSR